MHGHQADSTAAVGSNVGPVIGHLRKACIIVLHALRLRWKVGGHCGDTRPQAKFEGWMQDVQW